MKKLTLFLALLLALLTGAQAIAGMPTLGGGLASKTPVLVNKTYNFGALTRAGFGGVALDAMKVANSPPVVSWLVKETKNRGTAGYWGSVEQKYAGTAATTTVAIPSTSYVSIPEVQPISYPPFYINGNQGGYGYVVGDCVSMNNGAIMKVATISSGAVTNFQYGPSYTCGSGTQTKGPTKNITGPSAVTQAASAAFPSGTSGSGAGVIMTVVYSMTARTPTPVTAGANANLGGNTTTVTDAFEFTVRAVGSDGSLSNTVVLTYNLIKDATSLGPGTFSDTISASSYAFGAGTNNNLQAWAAACIACSGTSGDLKVLLATDGNWSLSPNQTAWGINPNCSETVNSGVPCSPNIGPSYNINFYLLNFGAAISLAGLSTPTVGTNVVTIEDACRAYPATPVTTADGASSLPICDGSTGYPSPIDSVFMQGGQGSQATACDMSATNTSETYYRLLGLTSGNGMVYTYTGGTTLRTGVVLAGGCYGNVDFYFANHTALTDMANNWSYVDSGTNSLDIEVGQWAQNMSVNYLTCIQSSECFGDYGTPSGVSSGAPYNTSISHVWNRGFNQNSLTLQTLQLTASDVYSVAPTQYPGLGLHADNLQVQGNATPYMTLNRFMMLLAEGTTYTHGLFMGGMPSGTKYTAGFQVNGSVFGGYSLSYYITQSADSATVRPTSFSNITAVRQIPSLTPTNNGNGYLPITFTTNPTNGNTLVIGIGCQSIPKGTACTQPGYLTYTFKTTPSGTYDIQIGASANATFQNFVNAIGFSADGSTCNGSSQTAIGAAAHICAESISPHNMLIATSTFLISDLPASGQWFQSASASSSITLNSNGGYFYVPTIVGDPVLGINAGPDFSVEHTSGANYGASCTGSPVYYCGVMALSNMYLDGAINSYDGYAFCSAASATAASQFPASYFSFSNTVGGGYGHATPGCSGATQYNKFVGDGPTNTAEQQLESVSFSQWRAMPPYQVCSTYAAILTPKTGGGLDLGGSVIGAITKTGIWNDGSGKAMCYDLGQGAAYTINPWPH